ncbi:MAG: helix-turn-helix domain-containing protein [Planctomycetota bacterium]|nr:helix-turn-helix domain-containing protein [Planctomycetota bacterium]
MVRDAGKRIRQARKSAGLTQTQLARRIGVSITTVSDWENGKYSPAMGHLAALSRVLRRDPSWFMGEAAPGRAAGAVGNLSVEEIDRLMNVLRGARRVAEANRTAASGDDASAAGVSAGEGSAAEARSVDAAGMRSGGTGTGTAGAAGTGRPAGGGAGPAVGSLLMLESIVGRMPRFENLKAPLTGMVAADTGDGRKWLAEPAEPGAAAGADAQDPRLVLVRGASAEEFARDGQHVLIDAACTNVSVGDVCVGLTRDGALRLKRKLPDDGGNRRYESINPAYPPLIVPARQVAAEFPVCAVITRARVVSPVETQDEGPPPGCPV